LTRDKHRRKDILVGTDVTPPESALLCAVHYGITVPPSDLPRIAARGDYSLGEPATVEECRAALAACLAKGWLRVLDESALRDITAELRNAQVVGPIYPLPQVGGVDFTRPGAGLWRRLRDRLLPGGTRPPFACTDVVHSRSSWYFPGRAAALAWLDDALSRGDVVSASDPSPVGWRWSRRCPPTRPSDVVSASDPSPVGPWRAQWWRRFPGGYRVDIERRCRFQRGCVVGTGWWLPRSPRWASNAKRLRHILDCHNVTLAEWLLLAAMDDHWVKSPTHLPRWVSESAPKAFGVAASEQECRTGLKACLQYGWLRVVDQRAVDEVEALLRDDPAMPPLSGEGEGWSGWGMIDFTPTGAALYRMIAAEYLGPDWEDDLRAWRESYREDHRYCETEEGLRAVLDDYAAAGERVRSNQVVPIGPWCVSWWEWFPAGYRMELQIGEV
jgi:hypothetical protein